MIEASRCNRLVKVAIAGSLFPEYHHDEKLMHVHGEDTEQAAYLGVYRLIFLGFTTPQDKLKLKEIHRLAKFHKVRFPELKCDLLRCRLENRLIWKLEPVELPNFF